MYRKNQHKFFVKMCILTSIRTCLRLWERTSSNRCQKVFSTNHYLLTLNEILSPPRVCMVVTTALCRVTQGIELLSIRLKRIHLNASNKPDTGLVRLWETMRRFPSRILNNLWTILISFSSSGSKISQARDRISQMQRDLRTLLSFMESMLKISLL